MQAKRTISFAILAALCVATVVDARSLRDDGVPAEVPPASYTGNQYVDSRGCVFIRAGVDGAVTWVPRVSRDRKLVCGFQPTDLGLTAIAAVPEDDGPEIIEIAPSASVQVATAPAPAPIRRQVVQAQPVRRAPAAPVAVHVPQAVAPLPQVAGPTLQSNCSHLSAQSQRYLTHATGDVRCGPQALSLHSDLSGVHISAADRTPMYQDHNGQMVSVAGAYPGQVVKSGNPAHGSTPVIPQHLYKSHTQAQQKPVAPPPGYRTVWKDDRLNPNRGVQTLNGHQAMAGQWTADKTPMQPHKPGYDNAQTAVGSSGSAAQYGSGNTIVLTPNTYVQVAAFAGASDAQRVARRVRSLGLPVKVGRVSQGYQQDVRLVLAGPFHSAAEAHSALSLARSAGYRNARIR